MSRRREGGRPQAGMSDGFITTGKLVIEQRLLMAILQVAKKGFHSFQRMV